MAGRDITEGRSGLLGSLGPDNLVNANAYSDVGIGTGTIWQNTGVQYDFAIAGIPFLAAIKDTAPYERATAPFRKQQFDSQRDPGEQSLTGWWLRSQSSFHAGEGINFYDPLSNPYSTTIASNSYRIKTAYGVNIWNQGEVTLLHDVDKFHITTAPIDSVTKRSTQNMRSIQWRVGTVDYDGVLFHDGTDVDRIHADGTVDHWIETAAGAADPVYSICDDGTTAFYITNDTVSGKMEINKKTLASTSGAAPLPVISVPGIVVKNAVIEYAKQRLVLCVNNEVYELETNATSFPTTPVYTHPNTSYIFTSVAESGSAIYIAGHSGIQSSIFKFTLTETNGLMPALSRAITAADMPTGEIIHKIFVYLGYMMIGTSKGVRVASIQVDGSLIYGPLLLQTINPVYDFAARDTFVWCASGVTIEGLTDPGVIRVDLSNEIDVNRFAYATDLHYDVTNSSVTTTCAFFGNTNRLVFATAGTLVDTSVVNKALTGGVITLTMSSTHGLKIGDRVWVEGVGAPFDSDGLYVGDLVATIPSTTSFTYTTTSTSTVASTAVTSATAIVTIVGNVYSENATRLRTTGYVETGYIRYNTLEQKNFKRLVGQGDFTKGSMSLQTVSLTGNVFDVNSYDSAIGNPESTITQPIGAQDAIGLRFVLYRSATDTTTGPTFKGYQLKAVPAAPRTRIIKAPMMNYDTESDKYNGVIGYEGRAYQRLAALESAEAAGDVVTWQDFRTGETQQCLIEEVLFTDLTPPDKKLTGFGGVISLTIRTV